MSAITLSEYLAKTSAPEPFEATGDGGETVTIELRHPTRRQLEEIYSKLEGEEVSIGSMKALDFAAIEACVVGADDENIARIADLGGEALKARLYDLIGFTAAQGEAQEVGNSPSGTTSPPAPPD